MNDDDKDDDDDDENDDKRWKISLSGNYYKENAVVVVAIN